MYIENRSGQIALIISASLAGFMALLDSNIVNISLPYIARYFHVGTGTVVQIVLVYMVVMAGTMIVFGKLADRFGVKRVFIAGFVIFTLSSALCGLSESILFLVSARAVQALGASMLFSTGYSLISRFIPPEKRGWAFGIFSPVVSLGLLVGNPLGGLITGLLNWHWIFLINIPVGILAVVLAWKAIPDDGMETVQHRSGRFDIAGALLSFTGLAMLVFCMNLGRKLGWTSPLILSGLSGSLVVLALFVYRERRAADPILDLAIFKNRPFSMGILSGLFGFALMAGSGVMMPFLLAYLLHVKVEESGFILMTFAVMYSVASPVAGNLSDHFPKIRLMKGGMALAFVASLLFALSMEHMHLWIVFAYLLLLGVAYAFFITPNNNYMVSVADPDRQSLCSSVFKLSTNLGQMTGVVLLELLFVIAMPAGFTADQAHAATLTAPELASGFRWAYAGGAAMCLVSLILTFTLREGDARNRPGDEPALMV